MTKIAIIGSRGYPSSYGGFETFVRRLAPWLAKRGHEVTVFGRGGSRSTSTSIDDVHVVNTLGFESKSLSTPTHGLTAAAWCVRHRPDVALVLNIANGPALPILRAAGIPSVTNVDGIEWERAKWGFLARAGFRAGARTTARWSTSLVADSLEIRRRWQELFDVDMTYIPYGADIPAHPINPDYLEQAGITPGTYVLAVARLVPENNIDLLLDAMQRSGWPAPLVVVGSANYRNPTEHRLTELVQQGRVIWLGHVSDQQLLTELWRHALLYFHGHSVGGTNPALLQAMASGAPVLAVDTPFNLEVLRSVDQLVPPDVSNVSAQLERLLLDPAKRSAWAQRGQSLAQNHYAWDGVLETYEKELLATAVTAALNGTGTAKN